MTTVEIISTFTYTPSDVESFYTNMTTNVFDLSTNKYRSGATFLQKDDFNDYVDNGSIADVTVEKIDSNTKVRLTVEWYNAADWCEFTKGKDTNAAKLVDASHSSMKHLHMKDRIENAMVVDYDAQDDQGTLFYNNYCNWVLANKQAHLDEGKSADFAHCEILLLDDKHASYSVPSGGWAWSQWDNS